MTTLAQLNQTYQTVKTWDRKIGHYMGADFLRRDDVNSITYPLWLAVRIVFAGAAAALLSIMFYAVISMGNPVLFWIAQFGLGIGFYLIGQSIYPAHPAASAAIMIELAGVTVTGLGAGIYHIPALVTFKAVMPIWFPISLGLLVALMLLQTIASVILGAFVESPEQAIRRKAREEARSLFRKTVGQRYRTPQENRRRKAFAYTAIVSLLVFPFIGLLEMFGMGNRPDESIGVGLACILAPFLYVLLIFMVELPRDRALMSRLKAAGLIERDETLNVWRFKA